MRVREFARVSIIRGDKPGPGLRCTCGKCGFEQDIPRGSNKSFVDDV